MLPVTSSSHNQYPQHSQQVGANRTLAPESRFTAAQQGLNASHSGATDLNQLQENAAKIIQRTYRGYKVRTEFQPKKPHSDLLQTRAELMQRAENAVGQHYWGDHIEIPIHENPHTGALINLSFSVYASLPETERHSSPPHTSPLDNGMTLDLMAHTRTWPLVEKTAAQQAQRIAASDSPKDMPAQPYVFDFGPVSGRLGPNSYSTMVNSQTPAVTRAMHQRIAQDKDLYVNCIQFVTLMLYQEGLLNLTQLQKNDDFNELLKLPAAKPYDEIKNNLRPGDLVMIYTADAHEFCHVALFKAHPPTETAPTVIEIGGNDLTMQVRRGQIQCPEGFELWAIPLEQVLESRENLVQKSEPPWR